MEKPETPLPVTSVFETGGKIREWMDTGLDNHERLEIFFSLLNTMTNLEVRYFHTILHSFMGRDWQSVVEAQELIRRTNDVFSLRELYDSMEPISLLTNEMTRNQILLDFSVLHTLSTSCGEIICDFLDRADIPAHLGRLEDDQVLSDLLMIINMGYRHPALRFHRRLRLGQLAVELVNRRTAIRTPSVSSTVPVMNSVGTSTASLCSEELNEFSLNPLMEPSQLLSDFGDLDQSQIGEPVMGLHGHDYQALPAKPGPGPPDDSKIKSLSDTDVVAGQTFSLGPDSVTRLKTSNSCGSCMSREEGLKTPTNITTSKPPWKANPKRPARIKSCYNCGKCGHWGEHCRNRPQWEWDPYAGVDYCVTTDDSYRKSAELLRNSETFYPPRHGGKTWSGK